jgi:hypothetical protein
MLTKLSKLLARTQASAVTSQVDDRPGWQSLTGRAQDYEPARVQELYQDALTAWRKNPIAWRIISITTDYVVGDSIQISSPNRRLNRFISEFWHHPKNRLDLRLEAMCDELSRAGDLFVLLFCNPIDGMSYLRFVTKDRITRIESAANDWETELSYIESSELGEEKTWLSPDHPSAAQADAIMLHYAVNKPLGALLGEGDLTTLIPWLQRYSRMLEDRVRLHWAIRAFLWMVTVPSTKVKEKQEQYRIPPEAGSIIVKDESEVWEVQAPALHSADAAHDMGAVRGMIDAGSGYPPHWRGEAADANLATATAMQAPTERHLTRRQKYFIYMLQDILYHAYLRQAQTGRGRLLASEEYARLFTVISPDISRSDNEALARSARDMAGAMSELAAQLPGRSQTLSRLSLRLFSRFSGLPVTEDEIGRIIDEMTKKNPSTDYTDATDL